MIGNTKLFIVDIEISTIEKLKDLFFNNPQLGISFIGHAQNYNNCLNELSRAKEADVFLISAYLPDTMGYELIQHIKKANPKAKVIITLETATRNLAELCIQKGADGILQKPFKAKELVNKIEELVSKPKPQEDFNMFGNPEPKQTFQAPPVKQEPSFEQPKQPFSPFQNQEPREERPMQQPTFEPKQEEKKPFFFNPPSQEETFQEPQGRPEPSFHPFQNQEPKEERPVAQPTFEPKQEERKPFFFNPEPKENKQSQPTFEPNQPTFEPQAPTFESNQEKRPFYFEPKQPEQPRQEEQTPFFFNSQQKQEVAPSQNNRQVFETSFPQKQDLPYSVTPVEETNTYMNTTQKRATFDFDSEVNNSLFDFKKDDFEGDKPKQVVTFISPSSAGKTTMLINVAGAIAKHSEHKPRICILDFNLLFPSVIYKLHSNDLIESEKNIYHLCSDIHHISEKLIKEVTITHEPTGIQIVYTPEDVIRDSSILNENTIEEIIEGLKEYFDLILIDTSSNIQEDATLFPITLADKTFVFLEPDLSSLLNTRKLITMLKQYESSPDTNATITNKLNLVLNKYNPKKNVTSELLKKTIHNYDVKIQIPEDSSISSYSNNGQFFFENNTNASKATIDLARLIYPFDKDYSLASSKTEEKKPSGGGFFTNLFKK